MVICKPCRLGIQTSLAFYLCLNFPEGFSALYIPSTLINCRFRQRNFKVGSRNPCCGDGCSKAAASQPLIKGSSYLWSLSSPSEEDDEISEISKVEKDIARDEFSSLSDKSDRNERRSGTQASTYPSILPPPSSRPSDRFPSRRRGGRKITRLNTSTSQPEPERLNFESILPPPPTSDNEQFPDRRRYQTKKNEKRGSRRRSPRTSGTGNFAKMSHRKFKPRKRQNYYKYRERKDGKVISSEDSEKPPQPPKEEDYELDLTSWDDFFANSPIAKNEKTNGKKDEVFNNDEMYKDGNTKSNPEYFEKSLDDQIDQIQDLPSPTYLFRSKNDESKTKRQVAERDKSSDIEKEKNSSLSPLPSLDGVLPVSELFYRSTQSISVVDNEEIGCDISGSLDGKSSSEETDDEELPFSAEQSDQILTKNNKILMRRNSSTITGFRSEEDYAKYKTDVTKFRSPSLQGNDSKNGGRNKRRRKGHTKRKNRNEQKNGSRGKGRKMVRRGMEMLVGGEPINADPPLRFVELNYCLRNSDTPSDGNYSQREKTSDTDLDSSRQLLDWASVITTNSRDFGPLLHRSSVYKVSDASRQLYCEHFVNSSIKWNVCPKDLKSIVKNIDSTNLDDSKLVESYDDLIEKVSSVKFDDPHAVEMKIETSGLKVNDRSASGKGDTLPSGKVESKGFGKEIKKIRKRSTSISLNAKQAASDLDTMNRAARRSNSKEESFTLGGELKFSLCVTRAELESGNNGGSRGHILRRVLGKGISTAIKADSLGFNVVIAKMMLSEIEGDSTEFNVEFNMIPEDGMKYNEVEWAAKRINSALARAMDDGDMALAMGAAAKAETAWPAKVRDRVVEEFLFDGDDEESEMLGGQSTGDSASILDDEDDFESQREDEGCLQSMNQNLLISGEEFDGPFGMPGDTIYAKDDIYLGGGNGGVFPDYSESGKSAAPFKGRLGPILVDAVNQRTRERQPRVIAIGDVHGCIDELQALLRRCDYRPGDLIVFLGDLVSKGPDSLSVVQMARELGAIGIRGNHDFEVIRWHQAIKSGADPPVIGSEHYQIASTLSKADLRWMYSLPWYLSSKELNTLFVHAGFVSGIRLGKQNPRLMMNMRSILPDGTVTSKFFNNWPWARLWDGPQTVLFGHDADRGLQQYEHAIGLDTGCVYGGRLTACILPEKRLVSVNAKREYFQYRRKHFD